MPRQYEDVHANPDSGCYMLQVTTLNFIFTPVVMGMTLTLVSLFHHHMFGLRWQHVVVKCRVEFLHLTSLCLFLVLLCTSESSAEPLELWLILRYLLLFLLFIRYFRVFVKEMTTLPVTMNSLCTVMLVWKFNHLCQAHFERIPTGIFFTFWLNSDLQCRRPVCRHVCNRAVSFIRFHSVFL